MKDSEGSWEEYKIIENWEKGERIENLSGKLRIGVDLEEYKMIETLRRDLERKERKLKIWVENWEKDERIEIMKRKLRLLTVVSLAEQNKVQYWDIRKWWLNQKPLN